MGVVENMASRSDKQSPLTPSKPEHPGGPLQATQPADKVNPPAAATSPIGRPPMPPPSFPGGAGQDLPLSQTESPAAPTTPDQASPAQPSQPIKGVAQPGGVGTAAPAEQPALGLVQNFDRMPTQLELQNVPPGTQVQTPYGTVDPGTGNLTMSPEGEEKYKKAMHGRRQAYGPVPDFANMPGAPKIPARLGGRMINPFTGQWID